MLTILDKFYIEADVRNYIEHLEILEAFKSVKIEIKDVYKESFNDEFTTVVYRIETNFYEQEEFIKNLLILFEEFNYYNLRFTNYEELI